MAMAFLNELPDRFDSHISNLDSLGDNDDYFTFDYVFAGGTRSSSWNEANLPLGNQKLLQCLR